MKRVVFILLAALLVFMTAYSADGIEKHEYSLTVNGQNIELSDLPVPIYEKDGSVMVPLRKIGEALGYKADWDEKTGDIIIDDEYIQKAVLHDGSENVEFIGRLKVINMNREIQNSVPTEIHGGCTYVPLEFFREFFNDASCDGININVEPSKCCID